MIEEFLKGNISINCQTESEAIELFSYLRKVGVLWKTQSPLNTLSWMNHRKNTQYTIQVEQGGLCYSGSSLCEKFVYFKDIPKEELVVDELVNESLKFSDIHNNNAIVCRSKEEADTFFEWLGWRNIKQIVSGGFCNKNNNGWFEDTRSICYVFANRVCTDYGITEGDAKKLGFNIISYKKFAMENGIYKWMRAKERCE